MVAMTGAVEAYALFWLLAGLWNIIIATFGWTYVLNSDTGTSALTNKLNFNSIRLRLSVFGFGLAYAFMVMLNASMFLFWFILYAGIAGKSMVACQYFVGMWREKQMRRHEHGGGGKRVNLWTPLTVVIIGDMLWVLGFSFMHIHFSGH